MHRGLLKLMRLQARSVVRRMFRGVKTPRGLVIFIVGLLVVLTWLGGTVTSAVLMPRADAQSVQLYFPLGMLAFCVMTLVTSAGERAVAFTPAEVDFLFPGPFSRRQLLGYKIARSAYAAIFTAILFSFVFLRYSLHWFDGWLGMFLALLFIQFLSMAVVLVGQIIGERAFTRGRKFALIAVALAVASVAAPGFGGGVKRSLPDITQEFAHSTSGKVVLAPFSVFANILSAEKIAPDALKWAGVALAMDIVLFIVVIMLDAHYLEAAASTGQKVYDRIQRFRRGGGLAFRASSSRLRLPMLPRFGGAGAIAWRQLTAALRTTRALLMTLLFICVAVGPVFFYLGVHERKARPIIGIMFWATFVMSNMLRYDFRGDLDLVDTLKAMPVRSWLIVIAELVAPVMMLVSFQITLLGSIAVTTSVDRSLLLVALLFALPLDAMLIAVENLIFLIFPVRAVAVSPGDLQGFGRQMLVFLLKSLTLLAAVGIAGGIGAAAWAMTGHSMPVLISTTMLILLVELVAMIPLLVLAFDRFDPSVDTPA